MTNSVLNTYPDPRDQIKGQVIIPKGRTVIFSGSITYNNQRKHKKTRAHKLLSDYPKLGRMELASGGLESWTPTPPAAPADPPARPLHTNTPPHILAVTPPGLIYSGAS